MGVVQQLAIPFIAVNVALLLFQLWTFLFLEPGSADFIVGLFSAGFFALNVLLAVWLIRSDLDI